jgi:hypothetical protein
MMLLVLSKRFDDWRELFALRVVALQGVGDSLVIVKSALPFRLDCSIVAVDIGLLVLAWISDATAVRSVVVSITGL